MSNSQYYYYINIIIYIYFNKIYFFFSGINEKGFIVEHPGKGVKHISGRQILDNHSVNLFSTVIIGLSLPGIAKLIL